MAYEILQAEREDLQEILDLQYLAFHENALRAGTFDIPPLKQTIDEVVREFELGLILKMVDERGVIIGSVRAREEDGTVYVGKLIVHPDCRKGGRGTALLKEVETYYPGKRFELFTGTEDVDNIRLYHKAGYRDFDERKVSDDLTFVFMEKMV